MRGVFLFKMFKLFKAVWSVERNESNWQVQIDKLQALY